jgi:RNA polymerase sigma-70 factor (ECF subfamily)
MSQFHRISIDVTLIRALMAGDRGAAQPIYVALGSVVHTLALRVLRDSMLADEVTQDTFIDVIEKAPTLVNEEAFVPWVRRIAVNHCLRRLRSPWYRRRDDAPAVEHIDPTTASHRVDTLRDVARALAVLTPETRFIVWMHDVEGYTHAEIGDLLGRSTSFSKSQLARGYAQLLEWSEECADEASRTDGAPCIP